ncbi:uncharacterized protein L201_002824 [Kwoniella dendrophila CBS 6074]|uniref:DUF7918 domain-containing protein n=1 Tax=Kwoniella dendrophila CBS 6074 TaxID=1295534 RepID=A0AAX4JT48_9TREE
MLSEGEAAGFDAWVEGKEDEKRLTEYQVKHHRAAKGESSYTECFLETIHQPFRINLRKLEDFKELWDFRVIIHIDGNAFDCRAWRYVDNIFLISWGSALKEKDGGHFTSDLVFAALPTTDDPEQITINHLTSKNLGTIEVAIDRVVCESGNLQEEETPYDGFIYGTLDEKGKNSANMVPCKRGEIIYCNLEPGSEKPFHRFVFHYRARPVLIQMGIIVDPDNLPGLPLAQRKRKRSSFFLDPVIGSDEEDVKPDLRITHLNYLQDRIKALTARIKSAENGIIEQRDVIDLTADDSDDE